MLHNLRMASKWKWYVYELCDPVTGQAFYVGKGSGPRMYAHQREASKGVCSKKCNKIRSLVAEHGKIDIRQIAFFRDEQDAYDFETDCIAAYGLESLTNIMPGGQVAWDRRRIERKERVEKSLSLAEALRHKAYDGIHSHFAHWLKMGWHKGKFKISASIPERPFAQALVEALYNKFIPEVFEKIKADPELMEIFKEKMLQHGVQLVYASQKE